MLVYLVIVLMNYRQHGTGYMLLSTELVNAFEEIPPVPDEVLKICMYTASTFDGHTRMHES